MYPHCDLWAIICQFVCQANKQYHNGKVIDLTGFGQSTITVRPHYCFIHSFDPVDQLVIDPTKHNIIMIKRKYLTMQGRNLRPLNTVHHETILNNGHYIHSLSLLHVHGSCNDGWTKFSTRNYFGYRWAINHNYISSPPRFSRRRWECLSCVTY